MFFLEKKSIYFDGVNAFTVTEKGYVAVGSNNNNDVFYEKAKLTVYNDKKENVLEKLYNKGFNSAFFDVIVDGNDYVAVGNFESSEKEHKKGYRKALLVKYDKDGNVLFEKSFSCYLFLVCSLLHIPRTKVSVLWYMSQRIRNIIA